MSGYRSGSVLGRMAAISTLAIVSMEVLFPGATAASEAGEDANQGAHTSKNTAIALEDAAFPMEPAVGLTPGRPLAFWPQGRRAFYLHGKNSLYETLTIADLGGSVINRVHLDPPAPGGPASAGGRQSLGLTHGLLMNDQAQELYVAYSASWEAAVTAQAASGGSQGRICVAPEVNARNCLGGIHVIDPLTGSTVRKVPFRSLQLDGAFANAQLRAMELSITEAAGAKLYLVLEEFVLESGSIEGTTQVRGVYQSGNVFLVQIDPEDGTQDWGVRVEACRGTREPRSEQYENVGGRPRPAAVLPTVDAVYVGCHSGTSQVGTVVRIPLQQDGPSRIPIVIPEPSDVSNPPSRGGQPTPSEAAPVVREQQLAFFGPDKVHEIEVDPASGRMLMRVLDAGAEVWWVFDTSLFRMLGTIGIGRATPTSTLSGLDRHRGRFYVLALPRPGFSGGLFVTDVRRAPLPQALVFPEFADIAISSSAGLSVYYDNRTSRTRLFVPTEGDVSKNKAYRVIADNLPSVEETHSSDWEGRTLDLDPVDGVTSAIFDGTARGYGARILLVGGLEAAARMGPADPFGMLDNAQTSTTAEAQLRDRPESQIGPILPGGWIPTHPEGLGAPLPGVPARSVLEEGGFPFESSCLRGNRDIVLGFVGPRGPAVVDAAGSRGGAEPVAVDTATRADAEAAASRCSGEDWTALLDGSLAGKPPLEEPRSPWPFENRSAECVSGTGPSSESAGDPVSSSFAAGVQCAEGEAAGFSYARGTRVGGVSVGEALSSFRIYRDERRGVVARVESVTRGIAIDGMLRINTVRGVAESWANGRKWTPPQGEGGEHYNPVCDFERSAGTCFQRHLFGIWTPGWSCGPCGDERQAVEGMSRGMGANAQIRLRDPDPLLARGDDNGFIAAVTKPDTERFSDMVLNNDLLQTVLPTLEIIRYAPPNRPLPPGGGSRGRQIYQFAGVEVSSSYGIQCLLVYDEAANTCTAPESFASLAVFLHDLDGQPLSGGIFEVRQDVDEDGLLGLDDPLLPRGACVTAEDGTGNCHFDDLVSGPYLITQVTAPRGYARNSETLAVELQGGEARTITFANSTNMSSIELKAIDDSGAALVGARFAAYPDPDADGQLSSGTGAAAECTTDGSGACRMEVEAGSYVLIQVAVPSGLEPIGPVSISFASGGQVASVTVVSYPLEMSSEARIRVLPSYTPPAPFAVGKEYSDPSVSAEFLPAEPGHANHVPQAGGGTVVRIIAAPGEMLRLLMRDPQQALAWAAVIALFLLAASAVHRGRRLSQLWGN